MADPDPEKLIHDFVRPLPVPRWLTFYGECHHCHDKLSSSHRHNCRVCGHLYCSLCTAKYHVPEEYKQKKKKGAVRVCYGCVETCLRQRREREIIDPDTMQALTGTYNVNRMQSVARTEANGVLVINPPDWAPDGSETDCFKCRERLGNKGHNCRVCGHMFDDACSTKMSVPQAYRKKGKQNPVRVCDQCRYLVLGGAVLSEAKRPDNLPDGIANIGEQKTTLHVTWEGDSEVLCKITDPTYTNTLTVIHRQIIKQVPKLASDRFVYLCRGEPVNRKFWDIFRFRHLTPHLQLRHEFALAGVAREKEEEKVKKATSAAASTPVAVAAAKSTATTADHCYALASYDYSKPGDATHLTFYAGTVVTVIKKENDAWWYGEAQGSKGWFPASYVKVMLKDAAQETKSPPAPTVGTTGASSTAAASTSVPVAPKPVPVAPTPVPVAPAATTVEANDDTGANSSSFAQAIANAKLKRTASNADTAGGGGDASSSSGGGGGGGGMDLASAIANAKLRKTSEATRPAPKPAPMDMQSELSMLLKRRSTGSTLKGALSPRSLASAAAAADDSKSSGGSGADQTDTKPAVKAPPKPPAPTDTEVVAPTPPGIAAFSSPTPTSTTRTLPPPSFDQFSATSNSSNEDDLPPPPPPPPDDDVFASRAKMF